MKSFFGSEFMALPRIFVRAGVLTALLLAGSVAGCGVRGALEAPPEAKVAGEAASAASGCPQRCCRPGRLRPAACRSRAAAAEAQEEHGSLHRGRCDTPGSKRPGAL